MRDVVDLGAYGTWRPAQRLGEAEIDTRAALERLGPGRHVLHSCGAVVDGMTGPALR